MQSIYVHFPFCEKKCVYCDFVSFKCDNETKRQYIEKLLLEIKEKAKKYPDILNSIYFGGGTPTSVDNVLIEQVLEEIKSNFQICKNAELTIEGNPATFDEKKLIELSKMGFNRFSVGVQSFNDVELQAIERLHTSKEAKTACESLQKCFPNYSLDLMLGLPFQTLESLEKSITTAVKLNPMHISCYMLKVEEDTPLQKYVQNGKIAVADDDLMADMYDFTVKTLALNGFNQYETSNFAKVGFHSKHNMTYWTMQNYLGVGIAAHSLVGTRRFYNDSLLKNYIENGASELLEENLSLDDYIIEYVMLALRLNCGVNLIEFKNKFNIDFTVKFCEAIEKTKPYLNLTATHISIKPSYFSVASSIMVEFM